MIRVRYRGCAIPVAWHIVPAQAKGAWMPHIVALLDHLAPAVPADWCPLVLVDRGLWSPELWRHLCQRRLHPLLRLNDGIAVRPAGRKRTVTPAYLAPGPGHGWVGVADVFGPEARQTGTLIISSANNSKALCRFAARNSAGHCRVRQRLRATSSR